ncbi:MAG: hypothetical protein ACO1OB_14245 [Archangium sp.]
MPRFPTRTLILMTAALFAFVWFWWQTHRVQSVAPAVELHLVDGGVK